MENKIYSVLIIDDHPLISEAYKSAFEHFTNENRNIKFDIDTAQNCDTAHEIIRDFSTNKKILDIVFLDIKLPPSKDGEFLSGEDLGLKITKIFPKTKIVVSTTFNDNYRVHSIFKSLNPDGFLIKNDITPKELIDTIQTIINDPPYYSKSVIKLLRKEVSHDFILDDVDRNILYYLSKGVMTKDLKQFISLSLAGIEKRKRHLKQIFQIEGGDIMLIEKAKELGFI